MSANPLVAGAVDTSTAFGGTGLLESLTSLNSSLQSGDWVGSALSGVGVALDSVATAMDPLGSLIAAGLGWLMEHLEPLKGWLNDLTGDAGAVLGFAGTWDNVAGAMGSAGDELDRIVRADLEAMSGASVAAYAAYATGLADRVRAAGSAAMSMGSALRTCSTIVQVVHDLVRDTLSQIVGAVISGALFAVVTVGVGAPKVVADITTRVASVSLRIGRQVTAVVEAVRRLRGVLGEMKDLLARLAQGVRGRLPGAGGAAPTPHVPAASPARHPSGMPYGDGTERSLYDQMMDPRIHRDNASIVEPGYQPLAGLTREEFIERFFGTGHRGSLDWRWPDADGAVPGTVRSRPLSAADDIVMDRVGGPGGEYFSPLDTPFGQRALPPDRLDFVRRPWVVDTSNPLVSRGLVTIETSEIAPAFGQRGGGTQYRFIDLNGDVIPQWKLERDGIIVPRSGGLSGE